MTAIAWLGCKRGEGAVSISTRAPTSLPPPRWKKPRSLTPNCPLGYDPAEAQGLRKGQKETPWWTLVFPFGPTVRSPWSIRGEHPPPAGEAQHVRHSLAAALAQDPGEARVWGGPQSPPDPIRGPVAEAPALEVPGGRWRGIAEPLLHWPSGRSEV